jgi:valyl-tRNA synthetase
VLATGGAPGNDMRISDERLEGGRNFANKIWNASRFVITSLQKGGPVTKPQITQDTAVEDRWILGLSHVVNWGIGTWQTYVRGQTWGEGRWERGVKGVSQLLEEFQIGEAGQLLHGFFWNQFCDWYVELAKLRLKAGDDSPLPVLAYVLDVSLRLLHPFMPFVTEAIWQILRPYLKWAKSDALIVAPWPEKDPKMETEFFMAKEQIEVIQNVVHAIRDGRTVLGWPASSRLPSVIVELAPALAWARLTGDKQQPDLVRKTLLEKASVIHQLARVERFDIVEDAGAVDRLEYFSENAGPVNVFVPARGLLDVEAERARLRRQADDAQTEVARLEAKLANKQFRTRAPAAVVNKEEEKLAAARARLEGLQARLEELA